jgi:hypothetical protein
VDHLHVKIVYLVDFIYIVIDDTFFRVFLIIFQWRNTTWDDVIFLNFRIIFYWRNVMLLIGYELLKKW